MSNPFAGYSIENTAMTLCTQWGLSVIPLAADGSKQPDFRLLPKARDPLTGEVKATWAPYAKDAPDEDLIATWWAAKPDDNMAVVCSEATGLVVLDCDDERAVKWVEENISGTPITVSTSRGKHFWYAYNGDRDVLKEIGRAIADNGLHIDIKGGPSPGYVVGPNSRHESGHIYTMDEEMPGAWEHGWVPECTWKKIPQGNLDGLDLDGVQPVGGEIEQGNRHQELLRWACSEVFGGRLAKEDILVALQQRNLDFCRPPLKKREVTSIAAWIFKTHGKHEEAGQSAHAPASGDVVSSDMDGLARDDDVQTQDRPWPEKLLNPGGLLGLIMDYILQAAPRPNRVFALAGAIPALGGVLGHKIRTRSGLYTNFYCVAVGGSGSGKDAPKQAIARLLSGDLENLFGGSDVSSDVSFLSHLCLHGYERSVFTLDEIGMFLKGLKNPNSPKAGAVKVLTELFSTPASKYVKRYADTSVSKAVYWHCLNIFGASVGSEFWGALTSGETTNGFLARINVFESGERATRKRFSEIDKDVPEELRERLKAAASLEGIEPAPGEKTGPDGKGIVFYPAPEARVVDMTKEAEDAFEEWAADVDRRHDAEPDAVKCALLNRVCEHGIKFALLKAGSDTDGRCGEISLDDLLWGKLLSEELYARTAAGVEGNVHETDFEMYGQRVLTAIRQAMKKSGRPGASLTEISRATRSIPTRLRDEVLHALSDQGRIRKKEVSTPGRSVVYYFPVVEEAGRDA